MAIDIQIRGTTAAPGQNRDQAAAYGSYEVGTRAIYLTNPNQLDVLALDASAEAPDPLTRIKTAIAFAPWGRNSGFFAAESLKGVQIPRKRCLQYPVGIPRF